MTAYPELAPLELGVKEGIVLFLDIETEMIDFRRFDPEKVVMTCVCTQACRPRNGVDGHEVIGENMLMSFSTDADERKRQDAATLERLAASLDAADLIVAHNAFRFDMPIVCAHARRLIGASADRCRWWIDKTWDTMYPPMTALADRFCSLDSLAKSACVGAKTGSGIEAPKLWKEGRHAELLSYCENDVTLLRKICVDREIEHPVNGKRINMALPISYIATIAPSNNVRTYAGLSAKRAEANAIKSREALKPKKAAPKRSAKPARVQTNAS